MKKKHLLIINCQYSPALILNSVDKDIINKIYLFGSYAYGTPNQESDIDLCVIYSKNINENNEYLKIARTLFDNNIIPFHLLIYTENKFEWCVKQNKDAVENIIKQHGMVLYG